MSDSKHRSSWFTGQKPIKRALVVLVAVLLLGLYLYGTVQQALYVNHGGTDQNSYRNYTLRLYRDLSHIDGNRMPLFPMLVLPLYGPTMSNQTLDQVGKVVGIGVSVVALTAIGIIFYHHFRLLLALNLLLITMFTVFVFKAPYYQPELLFYTLYFIAFVLMCKAFRRLTPGLGALIGLVTGLAMLAKGSAVSALAIFLALMVVQIVLSSRKPTSEAPRRVWMQFGGLALAALMFVVVMSGYMASSLRIFGTLYYNVNTTFYMWYDSWDEVVAGTRRVGDRRQWPQMPPEELPSLTRYLAEHTPGDIYRRIRHGLEFSYDRHCTTIHGYEYGYCKYIGAFGVAAVVVGLLNLPVLLAALRRNLLLVLFCALFLGITVLQAAWWVPIANGRRFMLAAYLPLMFVLGSLLSLPGLRRLPVRIAGRETDVLTLFLGGVLVVIALEIYVVLTSSIFWMYGGD